MCQLGEGSDKIAAVDTFKSEMKGGDGDDVLMVDDGTDNKVEGGKGADMIDVTDTTKVNVKGGDDLISTFGFVEGKLDGDNGNDVFELSGSDEFDFEINDFEIDTDKVIVTKSHHDELAADWDGMASASLAEFLLLEEGGDVVFEMGDGRDLVLHDLKFDSLENLTQNQVLDTVFDFG